MEEVTSIDRDAAGILPISSAPLNAASFIIGNSCRPINDFFMYCKAHNSNPTVCLPLGIAVHRCANQVLDRIRSSPCAKAFTNFWRCLDYNSQIYFYCRTEETLFYQCTQSPGSRIADFKKGLWYGDGPNHPAGTKPEEEYPEINRLSYKWHVYNYKYQYPKAD